MKKNSIHFVEKVIWVIYRQQLFLLHLCIRVKTKHIAIHEKKPNKFGGFPPTFHESKEVRDKTIINELTWIILISRGEEYEVDKIEKRKFKNNKGRKRSSTPPSNTIRVTVDPCIARFPSNLLVESTLTTSDFNPSHHLIKAAVRARPCCTVATLFNVLRRPLRRKVRA
jgi:hypothetical protein